MRDRDRYEILREHGRGGLGRVYRARDRELGREVALKEMLVRNPGSELRFFREAIITARLEHPGIVPVHDAGRWPDGTPFYAMKLVAGTPLSELVGQAKTPQARVALVANIAAVADAVGYAHARGVIHRDLKPSNVIVGDFGETVVIDWGLAKVMAEEPVEPERAAEPPIVPHADTLTVTGAVLGTPAYMSPEQASGHEVDARADVFAIGRMLQDLVGPPASRGRHVDHDLLAIIETATASTASQRYPSARELALDLRAYLAGHRVSVRSYSLTAALGHWIRHHRALAASIAMVLVIAAIAVQRIVAARDRALASQRSAELARSRAEDKAREALLAEAEVQLGRDPTMAWRTLSTNDLMTADRVLAARIRGRGVAKHSYVAPDPDLLDSIAVFDATRVAIVSPRRVLSIVDITTGKSVKVDAALTFPSLLRTRGERIAYVHKRRNEFAVAVASIDGTSRDLLRLAAVPSALDFDGTYVYVLDGNAQLSAALVDDAAPALKPIASDVASVSLGGDGIYLCTSDGRLRHLGPSFAPREIAYRCVPSARILVAKDLVLVVSGANTIDILGGARERHIEIENATAARFALSADGMLAAITAEGGALVMGADEETFHRVDVGRRYATAVGADRGLAVWGFGEGDMVTYRLDGTSWWSYHAHSRGINAVVLDDTERTILTWSANELRQWEPPKQIPEVLVSGTGIPFNAAPSPDMTRFVLDGATGAASILTLTAEKASLRSIHRHDNLAFGAAWCGDLACTAGWDNRVLCSDPWTGERRSEMTAPGAIRWMTPTVDGKTCIVASADGRVSRLDDHTLIYLDAAEPHRVRVAGDRAVIADQEGRLVVVDAVRRTVVAVLDDAHEDNIVDVVIDEGQVISAGHDGKVKIWSMDLEPRRVIDVGSPVVAFVVGGGRIFVATEARSVRVYAVDGRKTFDLSLGAGPYRMAVSHRFDKVAIATTLPDVLVMDLETDDVASYPLDEDGTTCLAFVDSNVLLACSASGEMFRLRLAPQSSTGDLP
jgi:WD40 repeat protein